MYAEGETELRDLIVQNLETSGFLNKIKAELRAGVFLAFEEEGSLRSKIPLFNKSFDDFVGTSEGKLAVSIVREFLEYFNLNFTLSVFDPEIACTSPCLNRSELCNKLNLKNSETDGPLISILLKTKLAPESEKLSSLLTSEKSSDFGNSTHKSETVLENLPTKSKGNYENVIVKDNTAAAIFSSVNFDQCKEIKENDISNQKSFVTDNKRKPNSSLIERLRNESMNTELHDKEKPKISNTIKNDQSHSIFKENTSSSNLDDDPFFDVPLPSEKHSFFDLPNENSFSTNSFKDSTPNKSNGSSLLGIENNTLSSLKNLPSLTGKSKDWSYSAAELPKSLPSLDTAKSSLIQEVSDKEIKNDVKEEDISKKEPDPESNEESSERQMNSDESIEEDLEGDFSTGLDDLLNSSLSLGDDATSDKTVSQVSVVDGVDHVEPILN